MPRIMNTGKIDIGTGRLEMGMESELPAQFRDIHRSQFVFIVYKMNGMWHAGIDKVEIKPITVSFQTKAQIHTVRQGHPDFHSVAQYFTLNNTGQRTEGHLSFADNSCKKRETNSASGSVTAHLRFAGIGIKKTPLEIHFRVILNQHHSVGTNRKLAATNTANEIATAIRINRTITIIDKYEIVPSTGHFIEMNFRLIFRSHENALTMT